MTTPPLIGRTEAAVSSLEEAISLIDPRLREPIALPSNRPETAAACIALLGEILFDAKAVAYLGRVGLAEAAEPIVRGMIEAYFNLLYLRHGDTTDDPALNFRAFALLEFETFVKTSKGVHPDDATSLGRQMQQMQSDHPQAIQRMQQQRSQRGPGGLYWASLNPNALIDRVSALIGADSIPLRELYKKASWDTHQILAPIIHLERGTWMDDRQ